MRRERTFGVVESELFEYSSRTGDHMYRVEVVSIRSVHGPTLVL